MIILIITMIDGIDKLVMLFINWIINDLLFGINYDCGPGMCINITI